MCFSFKELHALRHPKGSQHEKVRLRADASARNRVFAEQARLRVHAVHAAAHSPARQSLSSPGARPVPVGSLVETIFSKKLRFVTGPH